MTDSVISRRMPGGSLEPVSAEERILTLDVLRGLALLGVIISNMRWFSGLVFRFPAYRQYLQEFSLDSLAYHAVGIFVTGKAIATLSFLFGLGFYVQLFRAEQRGGPFVSVYCRRLAVLLMLGLVHMVLLWYGDILTVYAVFGFVLLWAARRSDRAVVIMAGLLIIGLPIALGVTTTVMNFSDASPELALGSRGRAEANAATLAVFQSGTYAQIIRENLAQARQFFEGVQGLTNMQYLGLFLLGLYVGRRRVFEHVAEHAAALRRIALWGLVGGICCGIVDTIVVIVVGRRVAYSRPDLALLMYVLSIGTFVQAAGYVATVALLLRRAFWKRWLSPFAAVGRMALTNYLMQTVVCLFVFYGFGLGLVGRTGPALGLLIALVLYATQMAWSRFWLAHFRMGPMEWIWRSATYGRPQPLVNAAPVTPQPV
jgi:uncharacterized protein